MMNKQVGLITAAMLALGISSVQAQEPAAPAMAPGEMGSMPGMGEGGKSGAAQDSGQGMNTMNRSGGMDMGSMSMQGGSPPPDARDPNAYADGYGFGPLPRPRMGDEQNFGSLLVERLERVYARDQSSTAYDLLGWYGRTYDRAVLKAEGDYAGGRLQDARTELLWGHAVAIFWDTQLGVRYDSGVGPDRKWLAFGVQGLAPYWFHVDATAYAGDQGRTALRLAAEYDLLFTQKLILQPRIEANAYGKSDPARELGSGLSGLSAGVRLRYEIRREFAPYIGVEWNGTFGGTADFARAAGARARETRLVAGLRFWF